jgi:hypothetical protein
MITRTKNRILWVPFELRFTRDMRVPRKEGGQHRPRSAHRPEPSKTNDLAGTAWGRYPYSRDDHRPSGTISKTPLSRVKPLINNTLGRWDAMGRYFTPYFLARRQK